MSRVDVIIPCYKYAHVLSDCVRSVLAQEGVGVRVLIIDDSSPDDTEDVARELAALDGRVEYRRHSVNQGHIATYNEGLEWAVSDYTLLISADDMLTPGALLRAARLMDAYPEVGLTYGRQIVFQTDESLPEVVPSGDEDESEILSGPEFVERVCESATNVVPTPSAVVRTTLQKALGGYREDLPHSGDMEMWLRFAAHASVGVLSTEQAFYRIHGKNMKFNYVDLQDIQQRRAAFQALFQGYGDRLRDRERLQSLAARKLAEFAFWAASRAFDRGEVVGCREVLRLALEIDPALKTRPEWPRLRWKRFIGPRAWSTLRPVVEFARGRSSRASLCPA
jgi:glycosyltransferase involved in cell wall biosynthesis